MRPETKKCTDQSTRLELRSAPIALATLGPTCAVTSNRHTLPTSAQHPCAQAALNAGIDPISQNPHRCRLRLTRRPNVPGDPNRLLTGVSDATLSRVRARSHAQREHHFSSAETSDYIVRTSASPCLRLRSAPNTSASQGDCLVPRTRVTALESVPYWRRVRVVGATDSGWAAKAYLEPAPPVTPAPAVFPINAWLSVHFIDVGQGGRKKFHGDVSAGQFGDYPPLRPRGHTTASHGS